MQTICQKCGHGNGLGHLFCVKCGAKLELTHVDEDIEDDQITRSRLSVIKLLLLVILVSVLVVIGLCAWPQQAFDADKIGEGLPGRIENTMIALHMVATRPSGTITPPAFRQVDINAWFSTAVYGTHVKAISLQCKRDKAVFRVVYTLGPYRIWEIDIPQVAYSMDVVGMAEKGDLKFSSARIGHMPLPGGTGKFIGKHVMKSLKSMDREKKIFDNMSEIKIEDGQITFTVTGRQ